VESIVKDGKDVRINREIRAKEVRVIDPEASSWVFSLWRKPFGLP